MFGGLSVSGEKEFDNFTLVPRVGAHLQYASAFDADVIASIPGYSESANLSLEDQSGVRFLGELGFGFGDTGNSSDDERYLQSTLFTPGVYCDFAFGSDQDTVCGARIGIELVRTDALKGTSWGIETDLEVDSNTTRGSIGAFYEQRMGDTGSLNFGVDMDQTMTPSVSGNLEVRF